MRTVTDVATEPSAAVVLDSQRCQFFSADGRRCRMPRSQAHPTLCPAHARNGCGLYLEPTEKKSGLYLEPTEQKSGLSSKPTEKEDAGNLQPGQTPDYAEELVPRYGDFKSVTEVNLALGKVFTLLAQNRISRRNAVALGYIAQLLLQTLPAVKEELIAVRGYQAWTETLQSVFREENDDEEENDEEEAEAPADGQNQHKAAIEAPVPLISAFASCSPEIEVTAPSQPCSEVHEGSAATRVFGESAFADSPGPETFAASTETNRTETPPEENPEQSPEPEEITPKCVYRDAYGNATVVQNVRVGLLSR